MKPLRILTDYAITSRKVQAGGIEGSARMTVRELRKTGMDVYPVRFRIMNSQEVPSVVFEEEGAFAWHEVHAPLKTQEVFRAEQYSWRGIDQQIVDCYKKIFEKTNPDAILINAFPWFQHYLSKAAQESGIPTVVMHHGFVYRELPFIQIPQMARDRIADWEKEASEGAAQEIFISHQSHRVWREKYPTKDIGRDCVIPLAISDLFFEEAAVLKKSVTLKKKERQNTIGWVGRWDLGKRPDYIAALTQKLAPDFTVHAVTQLTPNSKLDAESFKNSVHVHEPMPPNQLASFFQSLDACVLPSEFETLGKVVLEAALCGVPTFITNEVGLADVYTQTGMEEFLITGKNAQKDADSIQQITGRPPTELFVEYIKREHRSSVAYSRLGEALRNVCKSTQEQDSKPHSELS